MEYATLGKKAIAGEKSAGEDVRYDDDFETIEAEIAKLTSPSASTQVDWKRVSTLCETILETKSKHLLVTVYLVYALYQLRGIEGLNDGMEVLDDLLTTYWETLYPPLRRVKGRINAVAWLLDKLSKAMETMEPVEVSEETKERLVVRLKKIDDFLNNVLEDAPLFYSLIKLVEMKLMTTEAVQAAVSETSGGGEPAAAESSGSSSATTENREEDFTGLVERLNLLVGEMIQSKDYRSELFVINRAFSWLDIEALPSAAKNVTMLPPPDTQEREIIEKLYDEKDFDALLWAAESRVPSYLFWLDLHFYVAQSLENLDRKDAAAAVLAETRSFVKRLSGVENLMFSDKTPFAQKRTKQWLHAKEENASETVVPSKREEIPCTPQGIDRFSELIRHATSVEEAVGYNIDLCTCLAKGDNSILMEAYTTALLSHIEVHDIAHWNPSLALEAYRVAVECLSDVAQKEDLLEQLYGKIALLKPSLIE